MAQAPRFTITNRITGALTAIERARGFLEAATLSEDWVRRMSQRALLLEAHHTTHIEGTQLLEQTKLSLADCEKLLPDVARRTLQRDLKQLAEAGLIAEVGHGPTDPTRHYKWVASEL